MAVACVFTGNTFNSKEYKEVLDREVRVRYSKLESEETIEQLFKEFFEKTVVIHSPAGSKEYIYATGLIRDLLHSEAGPELVRRLMLTAKKLEISVAEAGCFKCPKHLQLAMGGTYCPKHQAISIAQSRSFYYVSEHQAFEEKPGYIRLAHEMLHALHDMESPEQVAQDRSERAALVCEKISNGEEQHTILGLRINKDGSFALNPLCENGFLLLAGKQLRLTHRGITYPKENAFPQNPLHAIGMQAFSEFELMLKKYPEFANQLFEIQGKKISLLSAAILFIPRGHPNRNLFIQCLLQHGAKPNLADGFGNSIKAAYRINDTMLGLELCNAQAL